MYQYDYQEGAELSEVIPRIAGAVKEQTENYLIKISIIILIIIMMT